MADGLRLAGPADLAAVERVVQAAYAPHAARIGVRPGPMLDDYVARIAAGEVQVWETDGAILGVLVLIPEGAVMLLDNVAVDPRAQGRGIGRALMAAAEAARDAGCRAIRLYTHEMMADNIALYARLGYAETHRGTEKGLRRVYMAKALG
jgi:ribosomal protein S18 acetylase RimI-like enzyme